MSRYERAWKPAERVIETIRIFPVGKVDVESIFQKVAYEPEHELVKLDRRNPHLKRKLDQDIPLGSQEDKNNFWVGSLWAHQVLRSTVLSPDGLLPVVSDKFIDEIAKSDPAAMKGKRYESGIRELDEDFYESLRRVGDPLYTKHGFYRGAYIVAAVFHGYQQSQEREEIEALVTHPQADTLAPHFRNLEKKGTLYLFPAHDIFSKN
jgi:hypothetical protein